MFLLRFQSTEVDQAKWAWVFQNQSCLQAGTFRSVSRGMTFAKMLFVVALLLLKFSVNEVGEEKNQPWSNIWNALKMSFVKESNF